MLWSILLVFLGLAAADSIRSVEPEYLDALRASGNDEEFARLLGVDVSLVRPTEERSEGSRLNFVSPLGDIVLTEEQERQGINFGKYPSSRWPNGRIPYVISNDFNNQQKDFIQSSIDDFNRKVRNVQLVRRNRQRDYVQVISGSGCWSYLGRTGNQQALSLQRNGCLSRGTIQHEFIHAAGFTHEQNRADRDQHVRVRWEDIKDEWKSQYEKVNEADFPNIETYEHYSIMHYPIWSPDNPGKDAFDIPPGIDRNRLGQGKDDAVTDMDVRKLNTLYS